MKRRIQMDIDGDSIESLKEANKIIMTSMIALAAQDTEMVNEALTQSANSFCTLYITLVSMAKEGKEEEVKQGMRDFMAKSMAAADKAIPMSKSLMQLMKLLPGEEKDGK